MKLTDWLLLLFESTVIITLLLGIWFIVPDFINKYNPLTYDNPIEIYLGTILILGIIIIVFFLMFPNWYIWIYDTDNLRRTKRGPIEYQFDDYYDNGLLISGASDWTVIFEKEYLEKLNRENRK